MRVQVLDEALDEAELESNVRSRQRALFDWIISIFNKLSSLLFYIEVREVRRSLD